ncbi:MAG: pseudouridylate synthase, partial [Sulfolobus sp.]|nr:pseudouridylate synthase [Sulfolobus sp.]
MESFSLSNEVLNKALELLKKYPLCDSCLGRCFAKLGSGLSNEERGKAIKITLLLQLDYIIKEHKINDLNELKELLFNIGEEAKGTFSLYFNEEFQRRDCYLCGGQLEEWKNDFYSKSLDLIKLQGIKSFILGVKLSETLKAIEHNFIEENGLMYYESVKNEVKREVGKKLATAGFPPNMENPDVEILYDIGSR